MEPLEFSWEDYDAIVSEGRAHTLLDVREDYEWERGHVATAFHLPRPIVTQNAPELVSDKSAFIITCCQAGGRAAAAARDLSTLGYTNVAYITGAAGEHYSTR